MSVHRQTKESRNLQTDRKSHFLDGKYPPAAAAVKSLQPCPTLCDPIDGSPPGSRPWDSPGKNTGVGCHFLLQCMKVKSESEVAQSCPILSDLMDYSLQVPPSMGFPRQEYWSGLPLPSPMHESEKEVAQACRTLRDPMDCSPPDSSVHGIPRKSTGVGCHCLL